MSFDRGLRVLAEFILINLEESPDSNGNAKGENLSTGNGADKWNRKYIRVFIAVISGEDCWSEIS